MKARGVALVIGLVLLAAISLLALTSTRGMVLQHRLAGNLEESLEALHNASIASADARAWLESREDIERESGCMTGCLLPFAVREAGDFPRRPEFESAAWWRANGFEAGVNPETGDDLGYSSGGAEPARWIIEELLYEPVSGEDLEPAIGGVGYYRIVARGSGKRRTSAAVTEAIVAKPWDGEFDPAPYPAIDPPGSFCRQFDASIDCGNLAWRRRK